VVCRVSPAAPCEPSTSEDRVTHDRTNSKNSRIYVAGNRGLVGSAIERRLRSGGFANLVVSDRMTST